MVQKLIIRLQELRLAEKYTVRKLENYSVIFSLAIRLLVIIPDCVMQVLHVTRRPQERITAE